jgi:hypothetical protein
MNTKQLIISLEYHALKSYLEAMNPESKYHAYRKRIKALQRTLERLTEDYWDAADVEPMEAIIPPPPPPPPPPPDDDL